jgi:hypothetical protein
MILVRLRIPFFFLFFPLLFIYLFACNSMYVDKGNITRPSTLVKITTTKKKDKLCHHAYLNWVQLQLLQGRLEAG